MFIFIIEYVKEYRKVACPNIKAIKKVIGDIEVI